MNCIIIGNGMMAMDCYKQLVAKDWKVKYIISSPGEDAKGTSFQKFLSKANIDFKSTEKINSDIDFEKLSTMDIDVVFTVNSYKMIKEPWFSIPKMGIINFHNSILPNYKGVNIPYWVIQNGEEKHGVTWHFINEKLDEGRIILQDSFELHGKETAAQVSNSCIKLGLKIFPQVIDKVKDIKNQQGLKSIGEGSCYFHKDRPLNDGIIDFQKDYQTIDRLVRGLNFLPYKNDFQFAYFIHNGLKIVVNRVSKLQPRQNETVGAILGKSEKDKPVIACKDYLVILEECMTEDYKQIQTKDIL